MIDYLSQLDTLDLLIVSLTALAAWIALCVTVGTIVGMVADR